ncbi:MAG TPA: hypothetical protein VIV59_09795, partial [Anaeromyxobacteraceae bacterium]
AVLHPHPGSWRARRALAARALEKGDAAAAADHLAAVDPMDVPPADEIEYLRSRAVALSAAGREPEALEACREVFQADPGDEEAFDHLALAARATGRAEPWLELAARHDAALAASGNAARRRDLRCERARLFEHMGRLEAAEGAWRAALEIDPDWQPAQEALAALAGRVGDWAAAADRMRLEAERTADPAEAAALWLRRGRMLLTRVADPDAAAGSLARAVARAAEVPGLPAASRVAREARVLLDGLAPPGGPEAGAAPEAPAPPAGEAAGAPSADPVAEVLRVQAETASGEERAELYERLAGHLERGGDRPGAAAALLGALEADPSRYLTFSWFLSLAEGDRESLERGYRLRLAAAEDEPARAAALGDLGAFLAEDPARLADAEAALGEALAVDPGSLPAAEALARFRAGAAPPAEPPPLDLAEALDTAFSPEPPPLDLAEALGTEPPPEPPPLDLVEALGTEPPPEPPPLDLAEALDAALPPEQALETPGGQDVAGMAPGEIADLPPLDLASAFEVMEADALAVPEPGNPVRRLHAQARALGDLGAFLAEDPARLADAEAA